MTRDDLRLFCTIAAFTATVHRGDPNKAQSAQILDFARLIEAYCFAAVPDAMGEMNGNLQEDSSPEAVDHAVHRYKSQLVDRETAVPPTDRAELLKMYDRLLLRQIRREQREFYLLGSEDVIASRILFMAQEELAAEKDGI